ncbi:MAG: transposase [Holosporaceae bacterium]|nr:transposase [Holosporaceae bacterium]
MESRQFSNFIGIDVSKDKIDVFSSSDGKCFQIANDVKNISKVFKKNDNSNAYIVLENTGGYERKCLDTLIGLNFTIHRTDNRRAKNFMKSLKCDAKTDIVDAQKLSRYGRDRHKELSIYMQQTENQEKLRELSLYLHDLKKTRATERTRLQSPGCVSLKNFINQTIDGLNASISMVEAEIDRILKNDTKLQAKIELLCGYKGIAKTIAVKILAFMPELGTLDRREATALAGLAPIANDSGKKSGYRKTRGGRPLVKQSMFLIALSACRSSGKIKTYYESLLARGKKKMVALTACMRKIVVQINAILRDGYIKTK